ncbi:MAG: signal peptidase II [Nanoarchaeota archaeon]
MKKRKEDGERLLRRLFLVAFFIVVIDQLSKIFIKNNFDYIRNYGASFGILQGQKWLIVTVSIFVIALIIYYSRKEYLDAFPFILGGAVGNLIDRLAYGYVIDFIKVGSFPAFNVADAANTIGGILLVLEILKSRAVKAKE